jgi:hypothetical protein
MTASMRAVSVRGPRVLRIGVVEGGRLIDERLMKQRRSVTIGPNEHNTFVVAEPGLPARFVLFEAKDGGYVLCFSSFMQGKLSLERGVFELAELRSQARQRSPSTFELRLADDARGKVVIGATTFLFQFVPLPPVEPHVRLRRAAFEGEGGVDWHTTTIAACSFLLHFLAVGLLYSDWMDARIDEDAVVARLVESVRSLPAPPVVEEAPDPNAAAPQKSATKAPAERASAGRAGQGAAGPTKLNQSQAAALSREMEALQMATLAALTGVGPATAGVLSDGQVAMGALDQAAASGAGVATGLSALRLGGGGGVIRPGALSGGLAAFGVAEKTEGTEGAGQVVKVAGPKGRAEVGGTSVKGGTVSNASRVVAGLRAGFRHCFNRELAVNPDAQGTIRLSIRVGPGGEVQSVSAVPSGNLGSAVECVRSRARSAQFDPPEGGSAVIDVPVTFIKQ